MGATTAKSVPLAGDIMRRQAETIKRKQQEEQLRRQASAPQK